MRARLHRRAIFLTRGRHGCRLWLVPGEQRRPAGVAPVTRAAPRDHRPQLARRSRAVCSAPLALRPITPGASIGGAALWPAGRRRQRTRRGQPCEAGHAACSTTTACTPRARPRASSRPAPRLHQARRLLDVSLTSRCSPDGSWWSTPSGPGRPRARPGRQEPAECRTSLTRKGSRPSLKRFASRGDLIRRQRRRQGRGRCHGS